MGPSALSDDTEGRVITAEFDKFFLVVTYVPNAGDGLRRLVRNPYHPPVPIPMEVGMTQTDHEALRLYIDSFMSPQNYIISLYCFSIVAWCPKLEVLISSCGWNVRGL